MTKQDLMDELVEARREALAVCGIARNALNAAFFATNELARHLEDEDRIKLNNTRTNTNETHDRILAYVSNKNKQALHMMNAYDYDRKYYVRALRTKALP